MAPAYYLVVRLRGLRPRQPARNPAGAAIPEADFQPAIAPRIPSPVEDGQDLAAPHDPEQAGLVAGCTTQVDRPTGHADALARLDPDLRVLEPGREAAVRNTTRALRRGGPFHNRHHA